MNRLWLAGLLCVGGLLAHAQEEFVPAPAKLLTQFSFRTFTGGVVLLQGRVGNYPDTLSFILDTGLLPLTALFELLRALTGWPQPGVP